MDKKLFSIAAAYESMYQVAEEVKYPHMMYDPKTGKEVEAKTPADHAKFSKMGYTHEKPKMDEALDDDDKGTIMKVAKKLKKASAAHDKQSKQIMKDLEDDVKEAMDPVDPKAVKKDFKDRKDKDIDNDGDVDSSDEYLHKKRKAISKSKGKNEDEPEGEKGETAKMNPKKEDKVTRESTIRDRLMSIWEDAAEINEADRAAHYKGATKPENMPKDDARSDKKMMDGHPIDKRGESGKEANDSSAAEKSTKASPMRGNDNKMGDRQIINKIANAYKTLGKGKDV